jgi:RNA polymerase sigma-70 factor (ECF subfamily)
MIRAWCVKWGLQSSDADDVAQDVLLKLLNAMRNFRYDPSRSFCAWLRTVTQSALSDFAAGRAKPGCPWRGNRLTKRLVGAGSKRPSIR